ncbi:glycosyltransferase [bacterium]|nr:glycosyltransferase [bacterium]
MLIINPKKIKKADLVIGIPSYNEAKTIGFVTSKIAFGLKKYFSSKKSVIINVDNHSPDGTKKEFFKAKIDIPRIYISTPKNIKGKGYNFYNLFLAIKKLKAKVGVVVDADLCSIKPVWIKKLASPVFSGFEYVLPFYIRRKDDATITNYLVYPLIYGLLGWDVRQPIGGEFAFSSRLVDIWLTRKWSQSTKKFGIDIFMTLNALFNKAKVCQVNLGVKIHKPSTPNLDSMFEQVVGTLFGMLATYPLEKKIVKIKKIPLLGKPVFSLPNVKPNYKNFENIFLTQFNIHQKLLKKYLNKEIYKKLETMYQKKEINIDLDLWVKIVYDLFYAYNLTKKITIIRALKCLYFGRVASSFKQVADLVPIQFENETLKQAKCFFEKRSYFLNKNKEN